MPSLRKLMGFIHKIVINYNVLPEDKLTILLIEGLQNCLIVFVASTRRSSYSKCARLSYVCWMRILLSRVGIVGVDMSRIRCHVSMHPYCYNYELASLQVIALGWVVHPKVLASFAIMLAMTCGPIYIFCVCS